VLTKLISFIIKSNW